MIPNTATHSITATTPDDGKLCVNVDNPPTTEQLNRLSILAAFPGLAEAEWSGGPAWVPGQP